MTLKRGTSLELTIVKDDKGDLVADSHSILAMWRNYFSQLLNVHGVNDVRQTEIHRAVPLVPEPSASEVELAIEPLKSHKSPGINPLNPELNPICYLLALLGDHHFLHVSRIRVKLLTFRRLMSYIYGAPILDVSRSHTTTQHSR